MTCGQTSGFPTASQMEQQATNYPIIWEEICMLQQAILAASSQCQPGGGKMCTTVAGNTPMTFVAGLLAATVTSGGAGYVTDSPTVQFVPPVGVTPSILATGTLVTNGGVILGILINNPGSGYQPVQPTLSISSIAGMQAILLPVTNAYGQIVDINISNPGTGYTINDSIIASRVVAPSPEYTDAIFRITAVSVTGAILSIAIINPGTGYQPSTSTVNIVSSINPSLPYPIGVGFNGTVTTNITGQISGVVVNNTGAGYSSLPPYLYIDDFGSGATTSVKLSGTSVASIAVLTPGNNYTQAATGMVLNPSTAPLPNPPAIIALTVANNTFGTDPQLYWQVWANTTTNTAIQTQLNAVLSYFTGLGYSIQLRSNPATGTTLAWQLYW